MSSHEHSKDTKSKREERSNVSSRKQDAVRKRSRSRELDSRHNATALPDAKAKKSDENSQPLHSDAAEKRNPSSGKSKSDSNRSKSDHGKSEASKHRNAHEKRASGDRKHDAGKNGVERGRRRSIPGRHGHRHERRPDTTPDKRKSDGARPPPVAADNHSSKSGRRFESDKRSGTESHSHKVEIAPRPGTESDADGMTQIDAGDQNFSTADVSGSSDRKRHARRYLPPPSDAPLKFTLSKKARAGFGAPERAFDEDVEVASEGTDGRGPDADVLREPDFHLELGFDSEDTGIDEQAQGESKKNFQIVFNSKTATRLVEHNDETCEHKHASPDKKRDLEETDAHPQQEQKQQDQNARAQSEAINSKHESEAIKDLPGGKTKRHESSRSGGQKDASNSANVSHTVHADEPRHSKSNTELRGTPEVRTEALNSRKRDSHRSRTSSRYIASASGAETSTEATMARQIDAKSTNPITSNQLTDATETSQRDEDKHKRTETETDAHKSSKRRDEEKAKEVRPESATKSSRRQHDEDKHKDMQPETDASKSSKRHDESVRENDADDPTRPKRDPERERERERERNNDHKGKDRYKNSYDDVLGNAQRRRRRRRGGRSARRRRQRGQGDPRDRDREGPRHATFEQFNSRRRTSRRSRSRAGSRSRRRSHSRKRTHSASRRHGRHHNRRRSGSSSSSTSSSASSRSRSSSCSSFSSRSRSRSRSHRRGTRRSRSRSHSRSRGAHKSRSRSRSTRRRSDRRRPRTRSNSRSGTRRAADGFEYATSQHRERTDLKLAREEYRSAAGAHDGSHRDVSTHLRRSNSPTFDRRAHRSLERPSEPSRAAELRLTESDSLTHLHRERDQLTEAVLALDAASIEHSTSNGAVPLSNEEYERRVEQFLMFTQRGSALLSDAACRSAIDLLNLEQHGMPATPAESTTVSTNPPSAAPSSTMLVQPSATAPKIDLQALVASLTSLQQPSGPAANLQSTAPKLPYNTAFPFIRTVAPPLLNVAPFASDPPFATNFGYSPAMCTPLQLPPFAPPLDKLAGPNGLTHGPPDAYVYPPPHLMHTAEASAEPFGAQVQPDDLNHSWQFNGTRSSNFLDVSSSLNFTQSKSLQLPPLDRSLSQSSTSMLDPAQPVKPKARWMNMLSESDSSSSPPPPANSTHPDTACLESERCDLRDEPRKSDNCASRKVDTDTANKTDHKRSESPESHSTMCTVYSRITREPLFEYITECHLTSGRRSRVARGRHQRAIRRMVCACSVDDQVPCGTGCLNRMLFIECGADCPCGSECTNRQFQQRRYAPIALTRAGAKGFGLVALAPLEPDTFLMEYVGELLDTLQFTKRVREYDRSGKVQHHYFMQLNSELIIDATRKGNLSRFFNHSCEPNCETQKWTVNGQLRVGFFTQRRVERGEELTFDYQFQLYGDQQQKCYCGSAKCRGFLGTVRRTDSALCANGTSVSESRNAPETSAPSSKLIRVAKAALGTSSLEQFGASEIEEAIHKLVARARTGLRTTEQTLQLCRLLMRAERAEDRRALLDLLLLTAEQIDPATDAVQSSGAPPATDGPAAPLPNGTPLSNAADDVLERTANLFVNVGNSHPLRTFVNYHGLLILRMLLADVRPAGNEYEQPVNADMRLAVLRVLQVLPIMYKKEVIESNVRSLLERWHAEIESKLKQQVPTIDTTDKLPSQPTDEVQCEPEVKSNMDQPPNCTSESPDAELDVKAQLPDASSVAIVEDNPLIDETSVTPPAATAKTAETVATPIGEGEHQAEEKIIADEEQTNMDVDKEQTKDAAETEVQQPDAEDCQKQQPDAVAPTDSKPVDYDAEYKRIIEELFAKWQALKDDPYKIPKLQLAPGDVRTQSTAPKPTPCPVSSARPPTTATQVQAQKRFGKKKDSTVPLELKRQLFEASERARVKAEKLQVERNTLITRLQAQLTRLLNESFASGFVTLRDDEPANANFFIDSLTQRVGLMEDDGRIFTELVQLAKPSDTVAANSQRMNIIQVEKPVTIRVTEPSRYSVMQFITAADLLNATLLNAAPLPSSSDPNLINQLQTDTNLISAALSSLIGMGSPGLTLTSTAQPSTGLLPSTGESTAATGSSLPPSWACAESDDGRTYYYHTITRKTQWTVPTAEEDAAENQKAAAALGSSAKINRSSSPTHSHADSSSSGLLNFASREADAADRKALKRIISETVVRQLSKMRNRHAESLEELSNATQFKELARRLSYSIYEKELKRMLASNKLSRIRLEADDDDLPESHKGRKRSRKAASERENVRRKTKNFIVRYVHVKLAKVARRRKRAAKTLNAEAQGSTSPASVAESANQNESLNQDGSAHSRSVSESNSTKRLKATLIQICGDSDDAESDGGDGDGERLFESAWKTACASQSEPDLDAEPNTNDASATASPTVSSSKRPKLASANE